MEPWQGTSLSSAMTHHGPLLLPFNYVKALITLEATFKVWRHSFMNAQCLYPGDHADILPKVKDQECQSFSSNATAFQR
jgi:hypothetical protein